MNNLTTVILCILCTSIFFALFLYILHKNDKSRTYTNIPDYDIVQFPNFLSPDECDLIIHMAKPKLFPSKVYGGGDDVFSQNTRQSDQCWLDDSNCFVKDLTTRIKHTTNTHDKNSEQLQVVNYKTGGFFTPHYDACDGDSAYCERMDGKLGPRLWTLLIYLNDDYTGGETLFPHINKSVRPEKGKAVLFKNVDNNGNIIFQAFHGGNPVLSGEKWIANKWIRL